MSNIKLGCQLVSIIIPVYNEGRFISKCLESINNQTYKNFEVIVINDGSTDNSVDLVRDSRNVSLFMQVHSGPGSAKNFGTRVAKGEILVFIDGDMYLDKDYLKNIIKPLINKECIATYTTEEYVANIDNIWAKCWNINVGLSHASPARRINLNDETLGMAIRAVFKKNFILYGGFDPKFGYIDDRSITKLKGKVLVARNAICYHYNPDRLSDVFLSARWIGRSKMFKSNINNIIGYLPINSLRIAIKRVWKGAPFYFLIFKIIFDLGLLSGIIHNNLSNNRSK